MNLGSALLTGSTGGASRSTILHDHSVGAQMNSPADVANIALSANAFDGNIGSNPRAAIPQDGSVFLNGVKFKVHYSTNSVVLTRARGVTTLDLAANLIPPTAMR